MGFFFDSRLLSSSGELGSSALPCSRLLEQILQSCSRGSGRLRLCLLFNFHLFVSCGRLGERPGLTVSQASVKFRASVPEGPEEASGVVSQSLRLKLAETDVLQYTVTCYVVTRFKEKKKTRSARLGPEQRRNRRI